MKVLHILDHSIPILSGYSIRSKYILEGQRKQGIQVAAVTSPKHSRFTNEVEEINGIRYYRSKIPENPRGKAISKLPLLGEQAVISALYERVMEILEAERFDLIHAHSPVLCGLSALKAARKFGVPVIYEIRYFWEDAAVEVRGWRFPKLSFRYRTTRYLETRLAEKVDRIVTISRGLKADLISRGIDESKIHCVPNGVDTERFQPLCKDPELSRKYNLNGCFVIGFIGAFYRYEGIEHIIRMLPGLLKIHSNVKAVLVGGGEELGAQRERARLENLSTCLGVHNHAIFTGRVPYSEITRYYSIMDVVVYPRVRSRLTELVT
ncbi:TPA: glycosyltransferase, partial [Candidatus Poribacteria bacterium]|nr:glycosyltransferase [Candidatus Poribacteria bacterium]HEX30735.1 glycosyltransferase [Candidatus Poribacteria bacterium]